MGVAGPPKYSTSWLLWTPINFPEYNSAIKPQNLYPLLIKSSQSNFNLRSPDSYSARLIQYLFEKTLHFSVYKDIPKSWNSSFFYKYSVDDRKASWEIQQLDKVHIFREGHKMLWTSTLLLIALHRTKVRWRFRKILWLSQNIWTLLCKDTNANFRIKCHNHFAFRLFKTNHVA